MSEEVEIYVLMASVGEAKTDWQEREVIAGVYTSRERAEKMLVWCLLCTFPSRLDVYSIMQSALEGFAFYYRYSVQVSDSTREVVFIKELPTLRWHHSDPFLVGTKWHYELLAKNEDEAKEIAVKAVTSQAEFLRKEAEARAEAEERRQQGLWARLKDYVTTWRPK